MLAITKISKFDTVTRFRLICLFIVCINAGVLSPVLVVLRGHHLLPWLIPMFGIAYTIALKTNRYIVPFGNRKLFKLGCVAHVLFTLATFTYFVSPTIMIYLDSILTFFEIVIFSAYSITLQEYLTDNYPATVKSFQITRNSVNADGTLIGLTLSSILLIFSVESAVTVFILINILFTVYFISKRHIFINL